MNNTTAAVSLVLVAVLALFGGLYFANPDTIIETEYINNTIEVVTEVEVEVNTMDTLLEDAVADFLIEYEDNDRIKCNHDEYDFEELEVRKVYDDFSVTYDDDKTIIDFDVKLKYTDNDDDRCYKTFDVTTTYEDGEDVEVDY